VLLHILLLVVATVRAQDDTGAVDAAVSKYQKIEGKIVFNKQWPAGNWQTNTRVLVNYGQLSAFVREDGSFTVEHVPVGSSYIIEVASTDYLYESVRVDVSSKGKLRARRLNLLQPAQVTQTAYPLRFTPRHPIAYFRRREEWRVTDMLFSPMVLMMVVPMLLFMLLPKLVNTNDPQLQREMQQSMPKYEMPELSEVMANWFGGGGQPRAKPKPKAPAAAAIKPKR